MTDFIAAVTNYSFLQYAITACLLTSIGCGIIGTYIYIQRISFLAGGIAHSIMAGTGIAYFFGGAPIIGAIIAALIAAICIAWISLYYRQQTDILVAMFWSLGMAIGVIFITKSPNYNVDLMSYLFGNILLVSRHDIMLMLTLDVVIVICVAYFYQRFLACAFDAEFARLKGLFVKKLYVLLLCLIALTVVLLVQTVGMILMIALLTLPAAAAAQFTYSIIKMMSLAVLFGVVANMTGLAVSFQYNLPAGASIVIIASILYLSAIAIQKFTIGK